MTGEEPTIFEDPDAGPRGTTRGVSGKVVVIGMFCFGLLLTGLLYGYWELHTRPFRPLQEAIASEYPKSSPRVVGGRHKSHRPGSVNTLRIIVQAPYDATTAEHEHDRELMAQKIYQLARENHDVAAYESVEVHLEHRIPEQPATAWSMVKSPGEWDAFVKTELPQEKTPSP